MSVFYNKANTVFVVLNATPIEYGQLSPGITLPPSERHTADVGLHYNNVWDFQRGLLQDDPAAIDIYDQNRNRNITGTCAYSNPIPPTPVPSDRTPPTNLYLSPPNRQWFGAGYVFESPAKLQAGTITIRVNLYFDLFMMVSRGFDAYHYYHIRTYWQADFPGHHLKLIDRFGNGGGTETLQVDSSHIYLNETVRVDGLGWGAGTDPTAEAELLAAKNQAESLHNNAVFTVDVGYLAIGHTDKRVF